MNLPSLRKNESLIRVLKSLPAETRVELIRNQLYYMGLSPFLNHQTILGDLLIDISRYVKRTKLGAVYFAQLDVYLDEYFNVVQPDLIFVSKENAHMVKEDGIHGSPDIIIEILSPWDGINDLHRKKSLYEVFKIKEYFIVDPATRDVTAYQLVNDRFEEMPKRKSVIVSRLLNKNFAF
jgi:Uma2 family endonuclease